MSWQLFTKKVGEIPQNTTVVPFFRGEPLLHPRFDDMIEELQGFREVQLASNGDYLRQHEEAILKSVTFFSLSLHNLQLKPSVPQHEFLWVARDWGIVTQVSIVDSLLPREKKECFVDGWLDSVDRVRIYAEHSHSGYGDVKQEIVDNGQPCQRPFNELVSYWDGKVALCCQDWNSQLGLGDLNGQSIEEVWNNPKYQEIRNKHEQGKRKEVSSCQHCHQWFNDYGCLGELYTQESRLLVKD